MTVAERDPAPAAPPETNRWIVLVLVCLAQFMVVLDATIVNVAPPSFALPAPPQAQPALPLAA